MLSVVPPPPDEPSSPVLQVGDSLGPYVVEELLGEGTMGRVYRGRHQRLGRMVALKVLHDQLIQDKGLVARFLQEARLVNQINHAHIVEVHDFVEELFPERVYGVMELLRGKTLAAQLAERALSISEICTIGKQIADALHAAHRVDVVHRDLKPDNIFLTSREGHPDAVAAVRVKVLDFGVAKLLQTGGDLRVADTQSGAMVGTPRYMAPEQAAGLEVDARTDIYALGTILYEMLAGSPPFTATVFGQLAADIITQPPPPLPEKTQAGEPVPPQLLELIATCLKKRSEERPPSMAAVASWLERALEAPAKKPPSKGLIAAGLGVGFLAVVGLLVIALEPAATVTPAPAPVVPVVKPIAAAPPPPVVVVPSDVALSFITTPDKANVINLGTGALLGITPLSLKLPKAEKPLRVRFELKGYEALEREASLQSDQALELSLKPIARPKPAKVVKDGVLDPF